MNAASSPSPRAGVLECLAKHFRSPSVIAIDGVGLHSGQRTRVRLSACDGPVRLGAARLDELRVVSSARATTVEARGMRVGTVEHCFAALAGLGIREGVAVEVEGPEMPLLDGGARAWCELVARIGARAQAPCARIGQPARFEIGPSRYELEPGEGVHVEARIDFGDARIAEHARWDGDPRDFVERIAPARTFALESEVEDFLRRGLVRHVDRTSVVVVAPDAIHCAGRAFERDEPARHKLLDLIGDLYLCGGPPIGRVRAFRPGHASNVRMIERAIQAGVIST